jgi:hypothetical protein
MTWSTTEEDSLFLNLLTSNPVAENMAEKKITESVKGLAIIGNGFKKFIIDIALLIFPLQDYI